MPVDELAMTAVAVGDRRSNPSTNVSGLASVRRYAALLWLPVVLAATLRAVQLARPGYLFGITEYDDGVYVGEALRWVGGALPYRDFAVAHPPAVLFVLAPLAALHHFLGSDGVLGAARVLTAAVSIANVILVGRLLRGRAQWARFGAMAFLAVYPGDLAAAHTVFLEPFLNLFCLLGAIAIFDGGRVAGRRRILVGGAMFGLAAAVKIFAVLPILVLLVLLVVRHRRTAAAFIAGVGATFLVTAAPFLLTAPSQFLHQVIVDQVTRSSPLRTPSWLRLSYLDGVYYPFTDPTSVWNPSSGLPILGLDAAGGAFVVGMILLVVTRVRRQGQPLDDLASYTVGSLVVVGLSFLWVAFFWYHYASFLGLYLAIAIGLTSPPPRMAERSRRVRRVLLVTLLAGATALEASVISGSRGAPIPAALDRYRASACIVADKASLTIASGVFRTVPGCPAVVDSDGTTLAWAGGKEAAGLGGGASADTVTAKWEAVFGKADVLVLSSTVGRTIPMTSGLRSYLASHFRAALQLPDHEGTVYVRLLGEGAPR